jgi:NADH-quinone oxidoreductase subunit G
MAILIIDGREIQLGDNERLNGIEAARRAGVEVPHYCWHPGLSVVGSCRMCLVEVGMRDPKSGAITMLPKLVPACNTPVRDGTVLVTNSEKVQRARAMVEEGLLLRHPIDCPICDKAGECRLQDYHFQYGQSERRADVRPFTSRRRDVGPNVTLFVDRCIMCSRCVRFCREITGTSELLIANRGTHEEIDVLPEGPLNNKLSGNVVDLCPVGALCDKSFLYRQRVWFMKSHPGICTGCATGCSTWVDENQDRVWRIRPRENPWVNRWWMCNDGRYDYPHVHDPRRFVQPWRNDGGKQVALDWLSLKDELIAALKQAGHLAAVVSPLVTVEEAYLLCKVVRSFDADAAIVLGPVPVVGQDERFPGGFTVAAEKCPNRRGVEAVIARFAGKVTTLDAILPEIERGDFGGAWISGGYKTEWINPATAASLAGARLVILQDLFPSPLADRATYVLPAAAFPERDGSYVNRQERLQSVRWAIRPPRGVRSEGSLLWELLGREGLYNARQVLSELAAEIGHFHVAGGPIPDVGVDLMVNLLAVGSGELGEGSGARSV